MSAPLKDNKCIVAIFDSYAKTVMRNECRNIADEEKRKRKREDVGTEKIWSMKLSTQTACQLLSRSRLQKIKTTFPNG